MLIVSLLSFFTWGMRMGGFRVSRAKWRFIKKCSHEVRFARRPDARLPYPIPTGGNRVCITKKGDLPLRLLTNRSR
jgi:hypothetical protein